MSNPRDRNDPYDILIIGGGVNGAGIARDAAGRGYTVCLLEAGDFGSGTSSASTKLVHGGLRYLEYLELRLVRESLHEREILLATMPHICRPMRFVLPYDPAMRFEGETPVSRLLSVAMPWMKGRRPAFLIRLGLFLYDHLGGRRLLPPTRTLDLAQDPAGAALKPVFRRAFEYSDCWVDDSRLVLLNLIDAKARGAAVFRSMPVERAERGGGLWTVTARDRETGAPRHFTSRLIVNAAGPWLDEVLAGTFGIADARNVRLVRGSHIIVPRKVAHERGYFFQNQDSRILFALPYEDDFTLIGTTDVDHGERAGKPEITAQEIEYLCGMASAYFREPVRREDIVWTYSGVRPLHDDGTIAARAASRDYVLSHAPQFADRSLLNVLGGKITTYRRLAEAALDEIGRTIGVRGPAWTAKAHLPGGDLDVQGFEALCQQVARPGLPPRLTRRFARQFGTGTALFLDGVSDLADLGRHFGADLYEREVRHLMEEEWARTAEDVAFRRTRQGIRMSATELAALDAWMAERRSSAGFQRGAAS